MMMRLTGLILVLGAGLILAGCASSEIGESKDVNQDKIYQSYDVSFYEKTGMLETEAMFRFAGSDGTTLKLSDPSKVEVNGAEMIGDDAVLVGYFYEYSEKTDAVKEVTFKFTTTEEKAYENSLDMGKLSFDLPGIYVEGEALSINWFGPDYDDATLYVNDDKGHGISDTRSSDSEPFQFAPGELAEFEGNLTIWAEGNVKRDLKNITDEGGVVKGFYQTSESSLEVVSPPPPPPSAD